MYVSLYHLSGAVNTTSRTRPVLSLKDILLAASVRKELKRVAKEGETTLLFSKLNRPSEDKTVYCMKYGV